MQQRLQKALAAAGVASRRHAEEMIAAGRVQIDGAVVTTPGTLVDPDTQTIVVDGRPIKTEQTRHYVALHKPVGYVSTVSDRHAPQKVTDLVHIPGAPRLVPAGRLDADSEGLILLSNDGDFVYRVTHPSQTMGKTYLCTIEGMPSDDALKTLARGLNIGHGETTAPAEVRKIGRGPDKGTWIVEMTIHEGRNRQIRRMMETVGHPVVRLVRIRVGPVYLDDLKPGAWRPLTGREMREIMPVAAPIVEAKPAAKSPMRPGGSRPNSNRPGGNRRRNLRPDPLANPPPRPRCGPPPDPRCDRLRALRGIPHCVPVRGLPPVPSSPALLRVRPGRRVTTQERKKVQKERSQDMKLVIAVVHDRDRGRITESLLRGGLKFTKIGSTGGFLREGNVTLLIGVEENDVDRVLGIIGEASKTRKQFVNVLPPDAGPVGTFIPSPVEVEVGGAVTFVVDVERFERF